MLRLRLDSRVRAARISASVFWLRPADAVDYNAWMRQRLRELRVVPNTAQGVQNAKASALQDALGKENEAPQALQSQLKSLAPEPMPAPKQ